MKTCERCGTDTGGQARSCRVCGADLAFSLIGEVLGERYHIQAVLGTGGMGHVYRAVHVVLGKPFAVKVLAPEYAHDRGMLERFRSEALAASRLAHPHVVATVDFGHEDGLAYSVMELIEGRSLDTLVAEHGTLELMRTLEIGRQIGVALGAAHRAGIVHRDVKPGNIIVSQVNGRDHVKVVDFGLAVLRSMSDTRTTAPGVTLGTPAYVSPEQVFGRRVDARADVYGLGAVLYEMVTGTPPFGFGEPGALTLKHAYEQPLPPSARPGVFGLPDAVDDLIMRMLDKRLSVRPSDGDAAAEQLHRIASDLSAPVTIPTIEQRERAIAVLRFADTDTVEVEGSLSDQVADVISRAGGQRARAIGDELITHFDTAEIALRAAIGLRERLALPPAVAVHHGVVDLGAGGGIFGPPVNLALRLARLAAPGEVIASSDVKQRAELGMRAQLIPGGLIHLGGRSQPIPVYRVILPSQHDAAVGVPVVRGVLRAGSHTVDYVCECGAPGVIDLGQPHAGMGVRSRCRGCSRQLSILPYAPTGEMPVPVRPGEPRPGADTDELSDSVGPPPPDAAHGTAIADELASAE